VISRVNTTRDSYWYNTAYYKPGGPVILFTPGEVSDTLGYLGYLTSGMPGTLANITNGIVIIIEHRYYGGSIPVKASQEMAFHVFSSLKLTSACAKRMFSRISPPRT
jgi:Serine carboxypeptidase S28